MPRFDVRSAHKRFRVDVDRCISIAMPSDTDTSRLDVVAVRRRLVGLARRHSRRIAEAEDIAHDIIVAALRRGIALDDDVFVKSLGGAARRQAAFVARSAARRQAREARVAVDDTVAFAVFDAFATVDSGAPISALTPTLRTTVLLLLGGLRKAEVCAVLGINDAALRKRLQAVRAAAPLLAPSLPIHPCPAVMRRVRPTQIALLRRLSSSSSSSSSRRLAIVDPDGHGLVFGEVTDPGGVATAHEPAVSLAALEKTPC